MGTYASLSIGIDIFSYLDIFLNSYFMNSSLYLHYFFTNLAIPFIDVVLGFPNTSVFNFYVKDYLVGLAGGALRSSWFF